MRRLAHAVLVVTLLGGTVSAFAVTEALKLERLPLTAPRFDKRFSPVCSCPRSSARLSLRFRVTDTVDAVVVDDSEEPVRTLVTDRRVRRGRVVFRWDGRDEAGRLVPQGRYRLRVHLDSKRRTILIPNEIEVDTQPPGITITRVSSRVLSPDGDGRRDRLVLAYRASEGALPDVLVDGRRAQSGSRRQARGWIRWDGLLHGRPAPAGRYSVTLQARDLAGNLSDPSKAIVVTVRYVDLSAAVLRVLRGGRIRASVETDARSYRWSLTGARLLLAGRASTRTLAFRLPRRVRPGRYLLRVKAHGHTDTAVILVRRAR